jgi:ATP-dependent protease ClpP protease subunit
MKILEITGYIGEYPNTVDELRYQLSNVSPSETLDIKINSNGGSYPVALSMYDMLNQTKCKKRIRISPMAASAGAVIALLPGAEVSIPKNGLLRHHMPMVMGGDPKNAKELEEEAKQLKSIEGTLIDTVLARCGGDKERVRSFLNEDRWLTADQAKELGFVDKVLPLNRQKVSISNLVLPEQIVAHVETLNKEASKMSMVDLSKKLGISSEDKDTEDQLEVKIVNHTESLVNTVTLLTEERDELKRKLESKEKKPEFPERIVNMLVREREGQIDQLVGEGKITGAVATGLKKQFASKKEIVNLVDEDGNPTDGFDGLVSSLSENEKVINFGGQKKKAKLEQFGEGEDENPLIANAEARAKKAKEARQR